MISDVGIADRPVSILANLGMEGLSDFWPVEVFKNAYLVKTTNIRVPSSVLFKAFPKDVPPINPAGLEI